MPRFDIVLLYTDFWIAELTCWSSECCCLCIGRCVKSLDERLSTGSESHSIESLRSCPQKLSHPIFSQSHLAERSGPRAACGSIVVQRGIKVVKLEDGNQGSILVSGIDFFNLSFLIS